MPPVGDVLGDLLGEADGDLLGEVDGDGDVVRDGDGEAVGEVVPPPEQAPRSFHSDGVAAGFQPAPT
nr:hypothetical protein GCM10020063_097510 [Dactylosporangium thailandense]